MVAKCVNRFVEFPTLTNVWKDEQTRGRYLDRKADDSRVQAALNELERFESVYSQLPMVSIKS